MRLSIVLSMALFGSSSQASEPWFQFGGPNGDFRITPSDEIGLPNWNRKIGPGRGGVVSDGKQLYLSYAVPVEKGKPWEEVTLALDSQTGKTMWEEKVTVSKLPKQQYFGGAPMQPQATPCVKDGIVYTIGFTGLLHARNTTTGKLIWSKDLIQEYGAIPVQFGFAASPMIIDGMLIVHPGGNHSNVAFEPKTGKTLWKSESAMPSYATPVVMRWNQQTMIIQLTQNAIFGFDIKNGSTIWKYELAKPGLTNVPAPIPLDGGRILISGQGIDGTRLIQLNKEGDQIKVREIWHQKKIQFFYSAWVSDNKSVYGFAGNGGKRFTKLRVFDGSIEAQESRQTDANAIMIQDELLLLRGDGVVTRGKLTSEGFENVVQGRPVSSRCWAPVTVIGDSILIRSDTELVSIKLDSLKANFKTPADTGRTAMDDAFSGPRK
jgi:outer membrane protein assembly factor BamB